MRSEIAQKIDLNSEEFKRLPLLKQLALIELRKMQIHKELEKRINLRN
ncbi:hypothetical protein [Candidatus Pyrohabitans sp.]